MTVDSVLITVRSLLDNKPVSPPCNVGPQLLEDVNAVSIPPETVRHQMHEETCPLNPLLTHTWMSL